MICSVHGPRNKREFYRRWLLGEFGNYPATWTTADDLRNSGYQGPLSVRSLTPAGRMETGVSVQEALSRDWYGGVVFQQTMPDQDLIIQGALGSDPAGLWLDFCLEPNINFRQAMAKASQVQGLQTVMVLRSYVDPPSLDDLFELVERFPNAVIEFATFRRPVGVYPHRNTVIFEVREY
jgi:hypothetical protein